MADLLFLSLRSGELGPKVAESEFQDLLRTTGYQATDFDHIVVSDQTVAIPDLTPYAGVVIGGSSLNVTDETYSDYQQYVHAKVNEIIHSGKPTFLICFGIGLLAHLTGGSVDKQHPEQTSPTEVQVLADDVLLHNIPRTFTAFTGHRESVATLGPEVQVLASGPTCPYQFIRYREHVWASQFHLEMDALGTERRMRFFMDYGYFSPEDFSTIVASLQAHDSSHAHQILRNFLDYSRGLEPGQQR